MQAFRWARDVEYEDSGVRLLSGRDEIVLPVDTRVHFKITARESDVRARSRLRKAATRAASSEPTG